eukprot:10405431-Lingulodinium_polyedra.AAC.1
MAIVFKPGTNSSSCARTARPSSGIARLALGVRSGALEGSELLALRRCPPRSRWMAGVVFDDHVGVGI